MSFLESLYQRFLPTSPSAPPSDGPTSETHAAQDAVVRSSLDGSTGLKSDAPVTVAELVAWVKAHPDSVALVSMATFVHPVYPVFKRFVTLLPDGAILSANAFCDPYWFKRDGYAEVEANLADAFGRRVFSPAEANEIVWALHHAHARQ